MEELKRKMWVYIDIGVELYINMWREKVRHESEKLMRKN